VTEQARWVAPDNPGTYQLTVTVAHPSGLRASAVLRVRVERLDLARLGALGDDAGVAPRTAVHAIDRVRFEKTSICVDEDVRVEVDAHDAEGDDAWLIPRLSLDGGASRMGREVVLKVNNADAAEQGWLGPRKVQVDLIDPRYPEHKVASVERSLEVRDCRSEGGGLLVSCRQGLDERFIRCRAFPRDPPGLRSDAAPEVREAALAALPRPVRYQWDFPDDKSPSYPIDTQGELATLRLPERPARNATESYVVSVRATYPDGRSALGRESYLFTDSWFEQRERLGVLRLDVFHGFPLRKPGLERALELAVSVRNPFPEAIYLETVELRRATCQEVHATDQVAERAPDQTLAPTSLLGVTTLAPGARVDFVWTGKAEPGLCALRGALVGRGIDSGLPAEARWDMPVGARPAVQGAELEQVRKAMQILGQRTGKRVTQITEAELQELVEAGLIEPITPGPAPPPGPGATSPP